MLMIPEKPPKFWNDENIAKLIKRWEDGVSGSLIARELGAVSRSAVMGMVYRLQLGKRRTMTGLSIADGRPVLKKRWLRRPKRTIAREANTPAPPRQKRAPRLSRTPSPVAAALKTAPVVAHVAPPEVLKSLLDLERDDCRYPYGDPGDADFGYCGRPVLKFSEPDLLGRNQLSWCAGHARLLLRYRSRS